MPPTHVDFREKCDCINRLAALVAALDERGPARSNGRSGGRPSTDGLWTAPKAPDSTELKPALAAGIDAGHHCTHFKGRRPERTSSFADAYRRLRSDGIVIARSEATWRSRSRKAPLVPLDCFAIARPEGRASFDALGSKPNRRVAASFRDGSANRSNRPTADLRPTILLPSGSIAPFGLGRFGSGEERERGRSAFHSYDN
jgi:hypothetical protein